MSDKHEFKPCPFCGGPAEMEPWHGGPADKRLVGCSSDDDCYALPAVTGDTPEQAVERWNRREGIPDPAALLGEVRLAFGELLDLIDVQGRDETPAPRRESQDDEESREESDAVFWAAVKAARAALAKLPKE